MLRQVQIKLAESVWSLQFVASHSNTVFTEFQWRGLWSDWWYS